MRLDDPNRPMVGALPAIIKPDGSSRSVVVPRLELHWHEEGRGFSIECHAAFCPGAGRWYHSQVYQPVQLASALEMFMNDPEAFMEKELGWKWEAGRVNCVTEFEYRRDLERGASPAVASGKTSEEMGL